MTFARPPFEIVRDPRAMRARTEDLRRDGRRIAVVPTMGALHEGHLQLLRTARARADIVIVTMLFMEEHFLPVLPALRARRDHCDAMVCAMSAGEVVKLTRLGKFDMDKPASGPMALLKRLRGQSKGPPTAGGAQQMKMLRRVPQLLRFIPGTAQDVRAYFLTLQYWLGGSEENMGNLVRFLVGRYAGGPRTALRGRVPNAGPVDYPEVGVYHPRLSGRIGDDSSRPICDEMKARLSISGLLPRSAASSAMKPSARAMKRKWSEISRALGLTTEQPTCGLITTNCSASSCFIASNTGKRLTRSSLPIASMLSRSPAA